MPDTDESVIDRSACIVGTMGPLEPVKEIRSHELCLIIEVTAPTQDIASSIAGIVRHQGLHLPIPEWSGLITALACPYHPALLDRGAVYRFNVNHVVEPADPHEMFRTRWFGVDGHNHFGAEVKVTLRGGTVLGTKIDQPAGRTSANPLPQERLREKFENCAQRALPKARVVNAYASIMAFEKLNDVRAVNNAMAAEPARERAPNTVRA